MSLRMQLRGIVIMMIIEYAVPSHWNWIIPLKSSKSFMKVFTFIFGHAWETNTQMQES